MGVDGARHLAERCWLTWLHVSSTVWLGRGPRLTLRAAAMQDNAGRFCLSGQSDRVGLALLPKASTMFGSLDPSHVSRGK